MAGLDAVSALSRGRGAPDGRPQPGAGPVLLLPAQQVRQRQDGVREMSGDLDSKKGGGGGLFQTFPI